MKGERHFTAQRATLIVLGLLLVGTVFLLPQFVTEPWVADDTVDLPPVPEASPSSVAPSTAAELKRYRQESQTVLAEVVAVRDRLTEQHVEKWAEADFNQALALVESGDERYSYGEYATSLEQFRDARDRLAGLEERGREKLEQAKADGTQAVEALNLNVAQDAAGLAGLIAPNDPEVQALTARVEVLPQVAAHIEAGDQALDLDRYADAQAEYRAATRLDPAHRRAAESLARSNREVASSVFRGHMSRGFAALERGDYAGARAAFHEAGRVSPGDPAVGRALAQVANLESGDVVGRELEEAVELESREQWAEAVAIYETLLQKDPSLTDARVRLIPAQVRAELDGRLAGYIEDPLRLSSRTDYEAARTALADARGIPDPGPRLLGQIERLDTLVQRANSPIDVVFRSDNQTHVVLFRVADLGRFEQRSVKLRPGKYIAAGTRSGYRDVRVEFTVTGEALAEPIVVRCEEPIG
ncbi:MAG: hypothetical protein R3233_00655 [Xanthomonadales bacterium]|nr:hypothetical protein [Xanthomonadales bacterium]